MMVALVLMRLLTGVAAAVAGRLQSVVALLVVTGRGFLRGGRAEFETDPGGDASRCLRDAIQPPCVGSTPRAAEVDILMATDDKGLAETWLAVFSETVMPECGETIPGAILNHGVMETAQVSSRWAIGRTKLTRRQMIDRIATWLARRPADNWSPRVGDEVEMYSRYTDVWYPAVIDARSEVAGGGWPLLTVRIKGNRASDDNVAKSEIRPLDRAARLAGARREFQNGWQCNAYDRDNAKHLSACPGCPDCYGLGEYYRECACRGGDRLQHIDSGECPVCETPRCHSYNLYHGDCPVCGTPKRGPKYR